MADAVSKPGHYTKGEIESIEYIKDTLGDGFEFYLEGNVKKYMHRWRYKNSETDDLRKARQYLDWLIAEISVKPRGKNG